MRHTALLAWLFVVAAVVLVAGAGVGTAVAPAGGDVTPTSESVATTVHSPGGVTVPGTTATVRSGATHVHVADRTDTTASAASERAKTGESAALQSDTPFDCDGIEQEDVTLEDVDQEVFDQEAVGLETIGSTVERQPPSERSETFEIESEEVQAERICVKIFTGDRETVEIQLENVDITNNRIIGNGMTVAFERGQADYIKQVITFGSALDALPDLIGSIIGSDASTASVEDDGTGDEDDTAGDEDADVTAANEE